MSLFQNSKPFYFIRHGQTDWNKDGLAMGQVDIPLNETGRLQACTAALILEHYKFSHIVSSPLKRSYETAITIAKPHRIIVETMDEFKEANWGVRQGLYNGDESWLKAWREGVSVESAETFLEMQARVKIGLEKVFKRSEPVLIVAHGGVYWCLRAILGFEFEDTHNATPYFFRPPTYEHMTWLICPI